MHLGIKNEFIHFVLLSVFTTFAPDMKQSIFNSQSSLRFKRFSNKGYALFACLGRVVLVGVLTVPTLSHAKAGTLTTHVEAAADTLSRKEMKLDEVVVTGSRAPLTALQSAKIVKVITADDIHRAAVETVNDVLKLATGVDVRQRGGFGVQTDISINGGTFDQITILLNGVNISNPQTGHNATDFPVSLSDIERIEVLEGAAARVFGTSAFSGAINIVTRRNEDKGLDLNLQAGSFGTVGGDARVTLGGKVGHGHATMTIDSREHAIGARDVGRIHTADGSVATQQQRGHAKLGSNATRRVMDVKTARQAQKELGHTDAAGTRRQKVAALVQKHEDGKHQQAPKDR